MTKKKKLINGIIFLAGLIVFVIYYFKDNTDMEKVEKEQDKSAEVAADSIFENVLDEEEFESLNEIEAEQDSMANASTDSIMNTLGQVFSETDSV